MKIRRQKLKIRPVVVHLLCLTVSLPLLPQSAEVTSPGDAMQDAPITYLHVGFGFSLPGVCFSKDITDALAGFYGGDWRIQHLDFPVTLNAATGITNIVRAEYYRTATLFRHNIKYAGEITGFTGVWPYIEREYATTKMKYRDHQGLLKLNLLFPAWNLDIRESQSAGKENIGLFLICGIGVVEYTDIEFDSFNWTGMSHIFGLGIGAVGTRASFSADFKYSSIIFEETPFDSFQDKDHKAGYFSFHLGIFYGLGM